MDDGRSVGLQIQRSCAGEFNRDVLRGSSRAKIHLKLDASLIAADYDVSSRIDPPISYGGERGMRRILSARRLYARWRI